VHQVGFSLHDYIEMHGQQKHKIVLAPCCKRGGAIPLPTLCACRGMSWTDLYLCYNKERSNPMEYQTPISFTPRFNNTESNFYFPNLRTAQKRDKNSHAQFRDVKYVCTLRPVMSVVNNNSTCCSNASAHYLVQT